MAELTFFNTRRIEAKTGGPNSTHSWLEILVYETSNRIFPITIYIDHERELCSKLAQAINQVFEEHTKAQQDAK